MSIIYETNAWLLLKSQDFIVNKDLNLSTIILKTH